MSTTTQATSTAATDSNLSTQLQTSFADLYNLDKEPQAQTLFTSDAQITLNAAVLSLEQYNEHILEQRAAATHINVVWADVLAIPENEPVCH